MRTAVVACLVSAVLFGASTPAAKHLLGTLSPFTLAGYLYLGAALATAPFALRAGALATFRSASRPNRVRLFLAVVFGGAVGPVLMLLGLARAPAASVSLWLVLETVATTALAGLLFREHLGARVWIANGLVVAAGVLLAAPDDLATLPAALLVGGACLAWGLDNNLTSVIDGFTPAQITFVKGLAAGTANLALGLSLHDTTGPQLLTPSNIALALAAGALGYGASLVLYVRGAQHLGASRSQMLFATAPFFGAALAWIALGEPVLPIQLVAAVPMIAGLALLLGERHEHPHNHDAVTHTHDHRHDDGHHTHAHRGLPAWVRHTHEHAHEPVTHAHPHQPDLHHRHDHHE